MRYDIRASVLRGKGDLLKNKNEVEDGGWMNLRLKEEGVKVKSLKLCGHPTCPQDPSFRSNLSAELTTLGGFRTAASPQPRSATMARASTRERETRRSTCCEYPSR